MTTHTFADAPKLSSDPDQDAYVAHYLVKKKPGMTFEAFRSYESDVHAPLAMALPGLKTYRLTFFPPSSDGDQPYDAMATLSFESEAAHDAALASDEGQRALADLPNVVDVEAMVRLSAGAGDVRVGDLGPD